MTAMTSEKSSADEVLANAERLISDARFMVEAGRHWERISRLSPSSDGLKPEFLSRCSVLNLTLTLGAKIR
jgi:hypothetical protein